MSHEHFGITTLTFQGGAENAGHEIAGHENDGPMCWA